MMGVDLSVYRFDYDLTFCGLLMNADGTIYHVYGGRDSKDADSHHSLASLTSVLRATLGEHAAYLKQPHPPKLAPRKVVEDLPPLRRRIREGERFDCIHCHSVRDFRRQHRKEAKLFRRSEIWVSPDPIQVGLAVERDRQTVVKRVIAGSAAARLGLRVGDRLLQAGGQRLLTFGDLSWVLDRASGGAVEIPLSWRRGAVVERGVLGLKAGWKRARPEVFAWRPSKWPLAPRPGFGGKALDAEEKRELGLDPGRFAFRVDYLVTWGRHPEAGLSARKAGIRKGDIVYAIDGRSEFESMDHFHAWFRLTRKVGAKVWVEILRGGRKLRISMPALR